MRTLTILRDPSAIKRSALGLSWHPDGSGRVAVAYGIMEFQKHTEGTPTDSYIWNATNPSKPEATLSPLSALTVLNYNNKDHNLIGAGQLSGQITLFDLRKGPAPVEATRADRTHRTPVYDFAWTQSKASTELMSTSIDGSVLWWDLRKLGEPLEELALAVEKGGEASLGGMCLEYSPAAGATKFMVGTEQGLIVAGNRKAKTPADRITTTYSGEDAAITPWGGVTLPPPLQFWSLATLLCCEALAPQQGVTSQCAVPAAPGVDRAR
jgi:dynein intermediate chain 2